MLNDTDQGEPHGAEELLRLVYDELRNLTAQRLADEKPGETLSATVWCTRRWFIGWTSTPPSVGKLVTTSSPPRTRPWGGYLLKFDCTRGR